MEGNYGLFPRVLVGIVSLISVVVAMLGFASGFVSGLVMSAFALVVWTGLTRLILFACESDLLETIPGPPAPPRAPVVSDDVYPPEVVEAMLRTLAGHKQVAHDRILHGANRSLVAQARIIAQPRTNRGVQDFSTPDAEERREDREWAEMFRAL
jgi:hypothetical protein